MVFRWSVLRCHALCTELVGEPSFEIEDLIARPPATDDDCSLVLLTFTDSDARVLSAIAGAASAA